MTRSNANEPIDSLMPPGQAPSMVFVVGAGRSGTTLLRLMLDAHSDVYSGPEDQLALVHLWRWHQIDPSVERFAEELFCFNTASGPLVALWGLEERRFELEDRLHDQPIPTSDSYFALKVGVVREMVLESCAPTARVWCLKTPNYAHYPDTLEASAPDAVVVHLVRDGRDVARSYLNGPLRWHLEPPTLMRAAQLWVRANRSARQVQVRGRLRYHRLRYEDLVSQPRVELESLCSVLNIQLQEAMLEPEAGNKGLSKIAENEHGWHTATAQPINTSSIGRGVASMTTSDLDSFAAFAGDELNRYGYSLGTVSPTLLTRLMARSMVNGRTGWRDLRQVITTRVRWWRRARNGRSSTAK